MEALTDACRQAAEAILAADALLIGAGAGMGVDSGLPDFRGPEGFWRAYREWLGQVAGKRLAVIEFGAATGVPTVRWECEGHAGQLIRVNPRDTEGPDGSIVLPIGALQATQAVDRMIGRTG